MTKTLIGLAGYPSGGKDTVANYLVENHHFTHISTGDLVRRYITGNKLGNLDRDNLRTIAIKLRQEHGADHLVKLALEKNTPPLVVSGLRAIAEAQAIKAAGGIILACTAPIRLRYDRAVARGRIGDEVSFEKFKAQEEAEASNTDPEAQNITAVVALADYTIDNSGSVIDLHREIEGVLNSI